MKTVLYICHASDNLGGAALSLFNLINAVRPQVRPIVVLQTSGPVYNYFTRNEVKCVVANFPNNIRNNNLLKHLLFFLPKSILHWWRTTLAINKIKQEIKGEKIDIVHTNTSVTVFGCALSSALGAKHVWHFREFGDLDFGMRPFWGYKHLYKKIAAANATIAITKAIYDHWNLGLLENSFYLWDAVRSKKECVFEITKERYFVFCAAVLSKTKGIDIAIKAFGMTNLALKGYRFKIVGKFNSPDLQNEMKNLARQYDVYPNIDFLGYQGDVKSLLKYATSLLMCSRNEGLGRVSVEAMFYGCPVIARNSGGSCEFIRHEQNGFLFNNEKECSELMIRNAIALPERMVVDAQNFVMENFSEESYGLKILSIYNSI